jgi:SAM-dependent methyltransferase
MFDDAVLGPTVDFLAALAAGRPALELAIGTGRVAVPLSARGVDVSGIELSRAMAAQMTTKHGAERIAVTIGDMATTRVDGSFGLVYLVYNTISNLLSQAEQVACFRNAAAHLDEGGHFVVEVEVPSLRRLPPGEVFVPYEVTPHHIGIDEYDVAAQRLISHHYWIAGSRVERFDTHHRYAWPAEYDLMAELAGLTRVERWANWRRDPFTSESISHVSVWQRRSAASRSA